MHATRSIRRSAYYSKVVQLNSNIMVVGNIYSMDSCNYCDSIGATTGKTNGELEPNQDNK
jgi:hypothetical protein